MTDILPEPFVRGWNNKVKCHSYNILKVRNLNSLHIFKVIFGQCDKCTVIGEFQGIQTPVDKEETWQLFTADVS